MGRIHLIEHHFSRVSYWKEENSSVHENDVKIVISSNIVYAAIALNQASNVGIARINTDKCRYGAILALQKKKDQHGTTQSTIERIVSMNATFSLMQKQVALIIAIH